MNETRVVITGASAVCSLGYRLDHIVENLLGRKTHFSPVPFKSRFFRDRRVARVPDGYPRSTNRTLRFMSDETRFAVAACLDCIEDAGLRNAYPPEEIDLFAGTGCSGLHLESIANLLEHSASPDTGMFDPGAFGETAIYKLNPLMSFQILPNMPAAMCAVTAGIRGRNLVFNPWEGNALQTLFEACLEIRAGRSKLVLCGGSDCKTHSNAFITFYEYGLLQESEVVLSEGSAYLAVESREFAERRKHDYYCTIRHMHHLSYTGTYPGHHPGTFQEEMIKTALAESGLAPGDIDLVISSSDHTPNADMIEKKALSLFFTCPVLAPKQVIGNAYAAAGMIHVAIATHILKENCRVDGNPVRRIFITSFAPGSEKFCIILEK